MGRYNICYYLGLFSCFGHTSAGLKYRSWGGNCRACQRVTPLQWHTASGGYLPDAATDSAEGTSMAINRGDILNI